MNFFHEGSVRRTNHSQRHPRQGSKETQHQPCPGFRGSRCESPFSLFSPASQLEWQQDRAAWRQLQVCSHDDPGSPSGYYTLTLPESLHGPVETQSSAAQTFFIHSKGGRNQEEPGLRHSLIKEATGYILTQQWCVCVYVHARTLNSNQERPLRCRLHSTGEETKPRRRARPLPAKISISSSTSHCPRHISGSLCFHPGFQASRVRFLAESQR